MAEWLLHSTVNTFIRGSNPLGTWFIIKKKFNPKVLISKFLINPWMLRP